MINCSYSTNRFDQQTNNYRSQPNSRFNQRRNWHQPMMNNSFDPRISRPTYGMQHRHSPDQSMLNAWTTAVISPMNKSEIANDNNATTVIEPIKKKSKNYLNILGGDFNDADIVSD